MPSSPITTTAITTDSNSRQNTENYKLSNSKSSAPWNHRSLSLFLSLALWHSSTLARARSLKNTRWRCANDLRNSTSYTKWSYLLFSILHPSSVDWCFVHKPFLFTWNEQLYDAFEWVGFSWTTTATTDSHTAQEKEREGERIWNKYDPL